MKVWTRLRLKDKTREIDISAKSLTNYLYSVGPIADMFNKYPISLREKQEFKKFTADRIAGLLYLYFSHDTKRINDIINKYNLGDNYDVFAELEGYIEK